MTGFQTQCIIRSAIILTQQGAPLISTQRFRICRPQVVDEIFEDELVIINLKSGSYYSLDPIGSVVWQELDRQATADDIVDRLAGRYEAERTVLEQAVDELIGELRTEELIQAADGNSDPRESMDGEAATDTPRGPFAKPVLSKYTDMQDLLLLDPIHEVDESGWPSRKPANPARH